MMQASAIENSLADNMSNGLGFTAVITTWLSQLNPLLMIVVSFLFSMLLQGGSFLQSSMQIPASMAGILQGIIIFFVLGSEFFVRYKFSIVKKHATRQENAAEPTEHAVRPENVSAPEDTSDVNSTSVPSATQTSTGEQK